MEEPTFTEEILTGPGTPKENADAIVDAEIAKFSKGTQTEEGSSQSPTSDPRGKYKNMGADRPSRPREEGDTNRGMSDKDYRSPDIRTNSYYGPVNASPEMQAALSAQDELAKSLKGIADTPTEEAPVRSTTQEVLDGLNADLKKQQAEDAERAANSPDVPQFILDSQKRRAEQDAALTQTSATQELDEESLRRQQTLRDARNGTEPFTAGGDRDSTWSPDQSGLQTESSLAPIEKRIITNNDPNVTILTAEEAAQNPPYLGEEEDKPQVRYEPIPSLPEGQSNSAGNTQEDSDPQFKHLDELMTPEEAARYENSFGQMENAKSLDEILAEVRANIANASKSSDTPSSDTTPQAETPEVKQDTQAETIKAQAELIQAIKELTKAIEDLKKAFPNDPQIQVIANNILVGTGNIIGTQGSIVMGEGNAQANIQVENLEVTVTGEAVQGDKTGTEANPEGGEKKAETPVDELEKLNKEREELKKKLEDPNLTPEERKAAEEALEKLDKVIEKAEKKVTTDQQEAAEQVTELTEEDKKEFEEAGKKKEGFLATITRMFKGKKWSTLISSAGMSVGSALVMSKVAAATVALGGPIGAAIVGVGLVGLGGYSAIKTLRKVKETAESQGMDWKDLAKDKRFMLGALGGAALSGITKFGIPALVPGLSIVTPFIGMAAEMGIMTMQEARLNRQQEELVNKYLSTFEARRYTRLKEQGYLSREGVNIERIVADMTDEKLSEDERKTARKAAIAALQYMYSQTKDDKYKFLHYTVKENGQDVRKEIDITALGVNQRKGSTADYELLELTGINFESVGDTLDLEELKTLTLEASQHSSFEDRKALTNKLVSLFVGIESADVDTLLSEERKKYLESVAITTGFRTGAGIANSLMIIGSGAALTANAVEAMGQGSGNNAVEQQYRDELGDNDAEVQTYERADGTKVNTVDLDGDGTPDLIHDTATNEYAANTMSGAEKLFEIQNPEMGDVSFTKFETSSTGINGTFVGESGEVVGVVYTDVDGNLGVLNSQQLTQSLGATFTSGGAATFTVSSIQPNGDLGLNIGGTEYSTNLATLNGIPGVEGVDPTLGTDPLAGVVAPGDSVPSVLTKIMQQVKADNPGLQQYDDYELQRSLYQGNRLANDGAIRSEFGFTNPVQPGQEYNVRNSPTILGWLEDLNGGPVNLPEVGSGSAGIPGSDGINFAFNGANVNGISLDGLTPIEVPVGEEIGTPIGHLIGAGAMAFGAFGPYQVGGITRSAKVEVFEKQGDPEIDEPDPPKPPVPPLTPEQEKEYITQILRTQVFTYTKDGKIKVAAGSTFDLNGKKLVATENGWLLDDQPVGKEIKEVDKLVEAFLSIPDKQKQAEVLTNILQGMTVQKGIGRRVMLGSGVTFVKLADGTWREYSAVQNGERNPDKPESREVITAQQLADRILLIKRDESKKIVGSIVPPQPKNTAGGTQTTTEQSTGSEKKNADGTEQKKPEGGNTGVEASATTSTESGDKKKEEEKKEQPEPFVMAIRSILRLAERSAEQKVVVNGNSYKWNKEAKSWHIETEAEGAPKSLTSEQIIKSYDANRNSTENTKKELLAKDLESTLSTLTKVGERGRGADRLTIGTVSYTRVPGPNGTLLWRSKEGDESKMLTDKELAESIANIKIEAKAQANTEQAETTENKEKEKPNNKLRNIVRGALLAVGIGGGIAAVSAGVTGPVLLASGISSAALFVGQGFAEFFEKRYEKQYNEIGSDVAKREKKEYTQEDLDKRKELERKMELARKWREHLGTLNFLTLPMFATTGLMHVLAPQITDSGIKVWIEGTIERLRLNPEKVIEPFNLGNK